MTNNRKKIITGNKVDIKKLYDFHITHLKETMLPFWLERSVDYEEGGYFTCFDNKGVKLLNHDKYTWSQGRMVWIFSKLAEMKNNLFTEIEVRRFLELAMLGAEFLMKNCLLPNGNCTFIMDKKGKPKTYNKRVIYDTSFFGDCFVVIGLSRFARIAKNKDAIDFSLALYESIKKRLADNKMRMEPYPVPKGFRFHGVPMIMINVIQELLGTILKVKDDIHDNNKIKLRNELFLYINDILTNFIDKDGILHEMIQIGKKRRSTILDRYINPGHAIEDMWFIIHSALAMNKIEYVAQAGRIVKKMFNTGWDKDYKGLLLFADKEGGKPVGNVGGYGDDLMVKKIRSDWDNKLWWPHCEALYSTLLLYHLTGEEEYFNMYIKMHDYTYKTFPNPDKSIGEWIQIRDRRGKPVTKVVALPVKDPFHIIRANILIIELIERYLGKDRKHEGDFWI